MSHRHHLSTKRPYMNKTKPIILYGRDYKPELLWRECKPWKLPSNRDSEVSLNGNGIVFSSVVFNRSTLRRTNGMRITIQHQQPSCCEDPRHRLDTIRWWLRFYDWLANDHRIEIKYPPLFPLLWSVNRILRLIFIFAFTLPAFS